MHIGEPQRIITVEPLELPIAAPEPDPEFEPAPAVTPVEPEKVPA